MKTKTTPIWWMTLCLALAAGQAVWANPAGPEASKNRGNTESPTEDQTRMERTEKKLNQKDLDQRILPMDTYAQAHGRASEAFPELFKGEEAMDYRLLAQVRRFLKQFGEEGYDMPFPALNQKVPALQDALKQVMASGQVPQAATDRLGKKLKSLVENDELSLNNAFFWEMLLVRSLKVPTLGDEDVDIFLHAPFSGYVQALLQRPSPRQEAVLNLDMLQSAWENPTPSNFPPREEAEWSLPVILEEVNQQNPDPDFKKICTKIPYPLLGQSILGLSTLLEANLKDVFPMGLPLRLQEGGAHGSSFTPATFATHDYVHLKLDGRLQYLGDFYYHNLEYYAPQIKPGQLPAFAQALYQATAQRYKTVSRVLNTLYQDAFKIVRPALGEAAFKQYLVGFFWMMHEHNSYGPSLYTTHDWVALMDQMEKMYQNKKNAIDPQTGRTGAKIFNNWESSQDPFHTSPLDGHTAWTDRQIAEWVIANSRTSDALNFSGGLVDEPLRNLKFAAEASRVTRSKRFIDVSLTTRGGHTLRFSSATLYHKWTNAQDYQSLLAYAGRAPERPEGITSSQASREAVQAYLKALEGAVSDHMIQFAQTVKKLLQLKRGAEGISLADAYFNWSVHTLESILQNFSRVPVNQTLDYQNIEGGLQGLNGQEKDLQTQAEALAATWEKTVVEQSQQQAQKKSEIDCLPTELQWPHRQEQLRLMQEQMETLNQLGRHQDSVYQKLMQVFQDKGALMDKKNELLEQYLY